MAIQQQTASKPNQGTMNAGNQTQPTNISANQPVGMQQPGGSILKKWWFWAIVGVIVFGGVWYFLF